ncbi:MAG: fumarylacetoacetate hydrolase family protein [Flavobacteriales bacterium]
MKLICIGRNYADHAKELGNAIPDEPVIFLKPESALLPQDGPIRLPAFSSEVHHELELVYRLERIGEAVRPVAFTIGLDLTARDVQRHLKAEGLPWEKAKAFDGSAYVALPFTEIPDSGQEPIGFQLARNGRIVQQGHSGEMLFGVDALIAHAGRYFRLETGDLLFTGTPEGVGPLRHGDVLEGYLLGERRFSLRVEGA